MVIVLLHTGIIDYTGYINALLPKIKLTNYFIMIANANYTP